MVWFYCILALISYHYIRYLINIWIRCQNDVVILDIYHSLSGNCNEIFFLEHSSTFGNLLEMGSKTTSMGKMKFFQIPISVNISIALVMTFLYCPFLRDPDIVYREIGDWIKRLINAQMHTYGSYQHRQIIISKILNFNCHLWETT